MVNAVHGQTETPQNWIKPDAWIGERLSGGEVELTRRTWEESDRTVIDIEEVLRHDSTRDLVEAPALNKVRELPYRSVAEIGSYLEKRLGLSLTPSKGDLSTIEVLTAQRNLVVHNRGKVDRSYKRKVPASGERVSTDLPVGYEDLVAAARTLSRAVRYVEEQVVGKFPALCVGGGPR